MSQESPVPTPLPQFPYSTLTNNLVCELGAGTGLPSIYAFVKGAGKVVVTDYPDDDILHSIQENVKKNIPPENVLFEGHHLRERWCTVKGYDWGTDTLELTK
jgi:EEF1A N-terminal glycine/lysine methyltransferase